MKLRKILGILVFGIVVINENSLFATFIVEFVRNVKEGLVISKVVTKKDMDDIFPLKFEDASLEEQMTLGLCSLWWMGEIEDPLGYAEENNIEIMENLKMAIIKGQQIPVDNVGSIQILEEKLRLIQAEFTEENPKLNPEEDVALTLLSMMKEKEIEDPFVYIDAIRLVINGQRIPLDNNKLRQILEEELEQRRLEEEERRFEEEQEKEREALFEEEWPIVLKWFTQVLEEKFALKKNRERMTTWLSENDSLPATEEQVCLLRTSSSLLMPEK